MHYFISEDIPKAPDILKDVCLDKRRPRAFFDGAYQDKDAMVGLGFTLYLLESHVFHFKLNFRGGNNNLGEFNSLFYLLKFTLFKHVHSL